MGAAFVVWWLASAVLPIRAQPAQGGLHWQLEPSAAPSGSLVWVEDTERWDDLPRQVPLVLIDHDAPQATSRLLNP